MTLGVTHSTPSDATFSATGAAAWDAGHSITGTLDAAQFPALTGDVTTPGGSLATTLATVNSNVGIFTNASITVDAKGRITAASSGSGGSTPTGTGFFHVSAGVQDAASKLVNLLTDTEANQGTTSTVLHGNAAGQPTWGAVSLTADVSGDLPFSSFVQASGASLLVGRGSASGAGDFQEISLGSGLSMSGTTLSATAAGGGTSIGFVVAVGSIKGAWL